MFNKCGIGVFKKGEVLNFSAKVNVKKAGVTNKDGKEEHENINKASSLDKLTSNLMINGRTLKFFTQMHSRFGIPWGKKAMGCYLDIYLKTDDLLLVNVFQTFFNACLKNFKLAPTHLYASPGLGKQTLLKTDSEYFEHEVKRKNCELYLDKFRLELTTDIDMLLQFKKDIEGGITQTVKHYANTKKNYEVNIYNHEDLIRILVFLDANFYVCAMIQKLQTHGLAQEKKTNDFTSEIIS